MKTKKAHFRYGFNWMPSLILGLGLVFLAMPRQAWAFRMATYNVENLFDLERDGIEYDDYVPYGRSGWTQTMLTAKIDNIARVVKDLNADVLSLQEIESAKALDLLRQRLQEMDANYAHAALADERPSAVKCAVLSRYPIVSRGEVRVGQGRERNILKVLLDIDGSPLMLYVNHWKSKTGPESRRLVYARALAGDVKTLKSGVDYIVTGDFNSNYNEYKTFRDIGRLNDTGGQTGINHVLGTVVDGRMVDEATLTGRKQERYLYNLWLELPAGRRGSVMFGGRRETPDAILVPASLYDANGVNYVDNSFDVFAPAYLLKNNRIYRWQLENKGRGRHLGKGFSDHLPVFAEFVRRPFGAAKKPD